MDLATIARKEGRKEERKEGRKEGGMEGRKDISYGSYGQVVMVVRIDI